MSNQDLFRNTCAAKLSYALNYSGFEIPKNTPYTYLGEDNKYYFINAGKMIKYLNENFKRSDLKTYKIKNVYNSIIFQEIYSKGVSGHVDVIFNKKSASGYYYDYETNIIGK